MVPDSGIGQLTGVSGFEGGFFNTSQATPARKGMMLGWLHVHGKIKTTKESRTSLVYSNNVMYKIKPPQRKNAGFRLSLALLVTRALPPPDEAH